MLISNSSIISIIIPQTIFAKIVSLWQELADIQEYQGIYLNEEDIVHKGKVKSKTHKFYGFQLFVSDEIRALLIIEKKIDQLFYQISITFETQEIIDFLEITKHNIRLNDQQQKRIYSCLHSQENKNDFEQKFLFSLLKILTEYLVIEEEYTTKDYQSQPIEIIIENKIAQEKILHEITQQIQQGLDTDKIINSTLKEVRALLQIDRLVIYQINPSAQKYDAQNLITYEAKASNDIVSVLNFNSENCFQNSKSCFQKYRQGFCLIVEDVNQHNLDSCLKALMNELEVKAKIAIPIVVKNKLWGLLIGHQCFHARKWKNTEVNFLKNIAEYLAISIYQYQSYQILEEQKNILEEKIDTKAKQLKDALIIAQIANKSKTEFLGNISHELRTPLTCIIGLSGTLLHWLKEPLEQDLPLEKKIRYLKIVQDSGRKLLKLINNVLDFADLKAGKSLLDIHRFSLENLSKLIHSSALKIAAHQQIEVILDYQVDEELDLFGGDRERIYQILLNLVDNAIKFTPEDGQVIIRFRRNKSQVIFQIEDTGIGINREQIPLLFTQFKQLENYRNRSYPGTGLGLALTKHLVELHGGIIEVESTIGKGSIFTVFLPESEEQITAEIGDEIPEEPELKINRTIVIVCDDEEIGTFLCELLTAADYQIIWLLDEHEANSRIRLIQPIIVILELELEACLTITQKIKSRVNNNTSAIVIKDQINQQESAQLKQAGVDEYLLKPLQPRILLQKISQLMNQEQEI